MRCFAVCAFVRIVWEFGRVRVPFFSSLRSSFSHHTYYCSNFVCSLFFFFLQIVQQQHSVAGLYEHASEWVDMLDWNETPVLTDAQAGPICAKVLGDEEKK